MDRPEIRLIEVGQRAADPFAPFRIGRVEVLFELVLKALAKFTCGLFGKGDRGNLRGLGDTLGDQGHEARHEIRRLPCPRGRLDDEVLLEFRSDQVAGLLVGGRRSTAVIPTSAARRNLRGANTEIPRFARNDRSGRRPFAFSGPGAEGRPPRFLASLGMTVGVGITGRLRLGVPRRGIALPGSFPLHEAEGLLVVGAAAHFVPLARRKPATPVSFDDSVIASVCFVTVSTSPQIDV